MWSNFRLVKTKSKNKANPEKSCADRTETPLHMWKKYSWCRGRASVAVLDKEGLVEYLEDSTTGVVKNTHWR